MDGTRFDNLTRTMATGTSRRRVLRLASGGLAAALLAAVGRGSRVDAAPGAVERAPEFGYCVVGHPGVDWNTVAEGDRYEYEGLPCGGGPNDCPAGKICVALVYPSGVFGCRCVTL